MVDYSSKLRREGDCGIPIEPESVRPPSRLKKTLSLALILIGGYVTLTSYSSKTGTGNVLGNVFNALDVGNSAISSVDVENNWMMSTYEIELERIREIEEGHKTRQAMRYSIRDIVPKGRPSPGDYLYAESDTGGYEKRWPLKDGGMFGAGTDYAVRTYFKNILLPFIDLNMGWDVAELVEDTEEILRED